MDMQGRPGKTMMQLKKPASGDIFFELLLQNFISTPTVIFREKCIESVGYYATDFKVAEDHHYNLRLAHYFIGKYIDLPLACYRMRKDGLSSSNINMCLWDLKVIDGIQELFPNRFESGKEYFSEARANLYYELGYTKYRQNEFKESIRCFMKCLTFKNTHLEAIKSLLVLLTLPHRLLEKRNSTIPVDESGLFS